MAVTVNVSVGDKVHYPKGRSFHVFGGGLLEVSDAPRDAGASRSIAIYAAGSWHSVELDELAGPAGDDS